MNAYMNKIANQDVPASPSSASVIVIFFEYYHVVRTFVNTFERQSHS
jgi:hypothetical protein